jgi:hypothetical protein
MSLGLPTSAPVGSGESAGESEAVDMDDSDAESSKAVGDTAPQVPVSRRKKRKGGRKAPSSQEASADPQEAEPPLAAGAKADPEEGTIDEAKP